MVINRERIFRAIRDGLAGEEFRVLVVMHGWLDAEEFLPLRPSAVAREMFCAIDSDTRPERWRERNVVRAIDKLVGLGYLEVHRGSAGKVYRLHTPTVGVDANKDAA